MSYAIDRRVSATPERCPSRPALRFRFRRPTGTCPLSKANLPGRGHVVIHWARRTQGLLLASGNPLGVTSLADAVTRGLRFALRPEGAGSRRLLDLMTAREGLSPDAIRVAERSAETHEDVADLVASSEAECGLGLEAAASGLAFVPLVADECFDLVMRRRDYFEPPIQALLAFTRTETFARRAALTKGTTSPISAGCAPMAEPLDLLAAGRLAQALSGLCSVAGRARRRALRPLGARRARRRSCAVVMTN